MDYLLHAAYVTLTSWVIYNESTGIFQIWNQFTVVQIKHHFEIMSFTDAAKYLH